MAENASSHAGLEGYNTQMELEVRYRDIDSVGHVNNAVYVTYLEQVRTRYIEDVLDVDVVDPGFVIANINIDYKRPIRFGETVRVGVRVTDLGTSSILMDYEIYADGERAATADTVMVPFDPETDSSRPVPEEWREAIEAHEGRTF